VQVFFEQVSGYFSLFGQAFSENRSMAALALPWALRHLHILMQWVGKRLPAREVAYVSGY